MRPLVSEPCQITWFSYFTKDVTEKQYVSEPCRTTWFSYPPRAALAISSRFRSVPNHLALLRGRCRPPSGSFFRAVPNHLDLLHFAKVRSELGVSEP